MIRRFLHCAFERTGRRTGISLKTRVGVVLTTLAAAFTLLLGGAWVQATRLSIHEEVEAATRVSEQWLRAIAPEIARGGIDDPNERLLDLVRQIGRVRANRLELYAADGSLRHVSPPPTYKAGRAAPGWFSRLLADELPARQIAIGSARVVLQPEASRAVLDAWDELLAMAGWAGLLLVSLFAATRLALARALSPLEQLMRVLAQTGAGRFDARLPVFANPEMGRLSNAFNGMADRLRQAVDANVRLETEREVAQRIQQRLEAERQWIARELHDEMAQGVTAVRALAGAIVQRTGDQPALHEHAQSIVAVTGEIQNGVRNILQHLRPADVAGLHERLRALLQAWQGHHDGVAVDCRIELGDEALPEALAATALRVVQEGLTNVARHAGASRVSIHVLRGAGRIEIRLVDDGRGFADGQGFAGSGLGLRGMRERVAAAGGELQIATPAGGGFALTASLPLGMPAALAKNFEERR